jgi:hypothetical protein
MAYGKLGLIKTINDKNVFAILDKNDNPATIIPDFEEWLLGFVGKTVTFTLSDDLFLVRTYPDRETGDKMQRLLWPNIT